MSRNATNADIATAIGAGPGVCYVNAGVVQELTLGTNLSISGTTLNAAGGSGGATLSPTAIKTGAYTLAAGDFAKADTSGSAFAFTLPTAPANGIQCGAFLAVAGNVLTVNSAGSDKFYKASGPTSVTLTGVDQEVIFQYNAAASVWELMSAGAFEPSTGVISTYAGVVANDSRFPARIQGLVGSETTAAALYMGTATPSSGNYILTYDGNNAVLNVGTIGGAVIFANSGNFFVLVDRYGFQLYSSHLSATGPAATSPTGAAGAGMGTGATVTVAGHDHGGTVTLTTGTGTPTAGAMFTLTFANAWTSGTPQGVVMSPANAAAAALQGYEDVPSRTGAVFVGKCGVAPAASTVYKFDYVTFG